MGKYKLVILGTIFLIVTLACNSVGIYDPEAAQIALQQTVTALEGTITALENRDASVNDDPSPVVLVVTATPQTATLTPTSSPSPVQAVGVTPAGFSQGETLDIDPTITATSPPEVTVVVATLTPTPTPKGYADSPVIVKPVAGLVVEEGLEAFLHWSWNGVLASDEYFDIKIRPEGQTNSVYVAWEAGTGHTFQASLSPGRYYWSVQVVQGYYKNNVTDPENRIFETFLSPVSEE
ncbi:MAG: hypothetical protein AAF485_14355, partial [Chloroflexota bacterium]